MESGYAMAPSRGEPCCIVSSPCTLCAVRPPRPLAHVAPCRREMTHTRVPWLLANLSNQPDFSWDAVLVHGNIIPRLLDARHFPRE